MCIEIHMLPIKAGDSTLIVDRSADRPYTILIDAGLAKDEIVTYTFLTPVFIATATPFIQAFNADNWTRLAEDIKISYTALNALPDWYMYVLFAIIIDVLGFRSFARKLVDKYIGKSKYMLK